MPVRSSSCASAAAASSRASARAPASTSSASDQPKNPEILVLARAPGGGERDRVLPEPVVQHRRRVLGQADRPPFSAGGRVGEGRLDQLLGLDPVAAPGGQQERRVPERRVAGGRADRIGLLDQRVGGRELPGVNVHAGPRRERDRKDRERTGVAGQRHRPAGEPVPCLVVPQVGGDRFRRDGARQPEPPHVVLGALALLPERVERLPQRRRGGGVAVREPDRQTVEQQVDRAERPSRGGRGASGVGHGLHAAPLDEPAGEDRRPERLEVRLAGQRRTERIEPPGGLEQQPGGVRAARAGERDLRTQARVPRALQLVELRRVGGRQELERRLEARRRRTWPARRTAPCRRGGPGRG